MVLGQSVLVLAADADQRLADSSNAVPGSATPDDEITILAFPKVNVKSCHGMNQLAAHENGWNDGPVSIGESLRQRHRSLSKTLEDLIPPSLKKEPNRRVDNGAFGMLIHVPTLYFQFLWQPDIVIIQKGDKPATGTASSLIASGRESNVHV